MNREEKKAKEKILKAALQLFSERGFESASVSDIAARAGVTKPMIYYHFQSKSGLYRTLVTRGYNQVYSLMTQAILGKESCYDRLLSIVEAVFRFTVSNRELVWLIFATRFYAMRDIPCEKVHLEEGKSNFELFLRTVDTGFQSGEFVSFNPLVLAKSLYGEMVFFILSYLANPENPLDGSTAKEIVDLFFHGAAKVI